LPYEEVRSYGGKCYNCNNIIPYGVLHLQTSNWQHTYNYCEKCGIEKGYTMPTDMMDFKRNSPFTELNYDSDQLDGLNTWPI